MCIVPNALRTPIKDSLATIHRGGKAPPTINMPHLKRLLVRADFNESSGDLWLERALFDGQHLESVFYGFHLAIFLITVYTLSMKAANGKMHTHMKLRLFMYIVLLFVACTINAATGIKAAEEVWIDYREEPGGPPELIKHTFNRGIPVATMASGLVAYFLGGCLLIWRCFVIWGGSHWILFLTKVPFAVSVGEKHLWIK